MVCVAVGEKTGYELRREFHVGDPQAIIDLHERTYKPEYGMDDRFIEGVSLSIEQALERGWPEGGAVRIVEGPGPGISGSAALTDEGGGEGRVRWVVLAPEARGLGLGRRMITEVVEEARRLGMDRLELDTFGALRAAASIYRSLGFELVREEQTDKWGPSIAFQRYVLDLVSPAD